MKIRAIIGILIVSGAILSHSLKLSVAFFHYALFNDNFTELYCENKDKPQMECHGKCQLKNQAEPESSSKHQPILNKKLHEPVILFYQENKESIKSDLNDVKTTQAVHYKKEMYRFLFLGNIFKPPIHFSIHI